jgi:L-fuculose-phosphate aldolase
MSDEALRRQVLETARAMNARGLSRETSGNVSVRTAEGYLITPSGLPYDGLAPADIVALRLDETPDESARPRASSEWRIHRDVYLARSEAGAIVHAHPPFATTLACARKAIPAFHYMVAVAGGRDIPCAGYGTYGTQALSDQVLAALAGRTACLMANHGMVALAASLPAALALAVEVEALAEQYWRALQVGPPALLDDEEMDRVLAKLRAYRALAPAK